MVNKATKVTQQQRVRRGEGTAYVIDNYVTSDLSRKVSVAVSHLSGQLWGTRNKVSDRVYYFVKGEGQFAFEDGTRIEVREGDAIFVPAGLGYKMQGKFDAVLVNSPPFNLANEERIEF